MDILWKINIAMVMGKSTISMAIFNSYVKLPEGITTIVINPMSWDITP